MSVPSERPSGPAASETHAARWALPWIAGTAGIGLAVLAVVGLRPERPPTPPADPRPITQAIEGPEVKPIDLAAVRERAWERIQPLLEAADRAATLDIQHGLDELRMFFEERKRGSRSFADAVLSLRGKWALTRSKLPFCDDSGHARYLGECFSRHIFAADELQGAIEHAVQAYLADLEAIENQLLVDIRADLADLPQAAVPAIQSDEALRLTYARMADEVAAMAAQDTAVALPRMMGSLVAGDVAAKITLRIAKAVAVRLGVSAGILGAGAAGSAASLGLTLVAGVLVDFAADWVIGWFYDPQADVTERVNQSLDRIRQLLLEGDRETPGLRQELQRLNASQAAIRRAALRKLVFGEIQNSEFKIQRQE